MKTTLKLVAVAVAVFGMVSASRAAQIDYYLWIDASGPGTWSLSASTTAAGGISAFAVNIDNALTGDSVAPRGIHGIFGPVAGFTGGNTFAVPAGGERQAFARQNTDSPGTLVYGIGFQSVPDSAFEVSGSVRTGSAATDYLPGQPGFQVLMYTGTYNPADPVMFSAAGTLAGSVNYPNEGGADTLQSTNAGAVWLQANPTPITPIGGAGGTTYAFHTITPVPEPGTIVMIGLAIPALAYAIRRRKAA